MSAFLDALATGRRPRAFGPAPTTPPSVRTAIELTTARPEEAAPDPEFVSRLQRELADQAGTAQVVPMVRPRPRGRIALVSVAAGLALVGATVAATETIDQSGVDPGGPAAASQGSSCAPAPSKTPPARTWARSSSTTGTLHGCSWSSTVRAMTVRSPAGSTPPDGSTVMTGAFYVRDGTGQLAKTIGVDVGQLGGAQLVTPTGATLASATFS